MKNPDYALERHGFHCIGTIDNVVIYDKGNEMIEFDLNKCEVLHYRLSDYQRVAVNTSPELLMALVNKSKALGWEVK